MNDNWYGEEPQKIQKDNDIDAFKAFAWILYLVVLMMIIVTGVVLWWRWLF